MAQAAAKVPSALSPPTAKRAASAPKAWACAASHTSGNYHKAVNMISAVGTTGELQFMLVDGPRNSYTFKEFLERLLHDSQEPVILVVDNHSSHKSAMVTDYVKSTEGKLELRYIPLYAPQLNPDEQVWKNVKSQVSKKCPSDFHEMRGFVREGLELLKGIYEPLRWKICRPLLHGVMALCTLTTPTIGLEKRFGVRDLPWVMLAEQWFIGGT